MKLGSTNVRSKIGNSSFVRAVIGTAEVEVPVFTVDPVVTGLTTPGATLTRTLGTASGATLSGQWVKNGTPTGVTTSTYAITVDGDMVKWAGVATNSAGEDTADSNVVTVAAEGLVAPYVTLNWEEVAEDEDGYLVEMSLNGSTWTTLATLPADTITYDADALDYNTGHKFRVSAVNGAGSSTVLTTGWIYTPVETAPTGLSGAAESTTSVEISFSSTEPVNGGFEVIYEWALEGLDLTVDTDASPVVLPGGPLDEAGRLCTAQVRSYNLNEDDSRSYGPISAAVTATSIPDPYFLSADFETGEDHTDWVVNNPSAANFNYTTGTALYTGGRLRFGEVNATNTNVKPPSFDATDEVHFAYVWMGSWSGNNMFTAYFEGMCGFYINSSGSIAILDSAFATVETGAAGVMVSETKYFVWISIVRQTGTDDWDVTYLRSTTATKPTPDASNSLSAVVTSSAQLLHPPEFGRADFGWIEIDHLRGSFSPIGSDF